MDELDRAIINTLQEGFPICPAPYKEIAQQLNNECMQLMRGWQQTDTSKADS